MTSFRATRDEKLTTEKVNPESWRTVADSKVVYVPLGMKPVGKKGEEKMTFARTGIRVEMADLSWWLFHFKSRTWTRHYTLGGIERKDEGITEDKLLRQVALPPPNNWPGPALKAALEQGVALALEAEAEKRAAARAA